MITSWNPSEIVAAIKVLLDADSTLEGASYLNGAANIWSSRLPNGMTGRHIHIEAMQMFPNDTNQYTGEIRIHASCDLLSNGQVDSAGNLILSQCEKLLSEESPTISGGKCQNLLSLGIVPSYYDSANGNLRSNGVLRLRATVGKSG